MTDTQTCQLAQRDFDVLSFLTRNGLIHRTDRQNRRVSVSDNAARVVAEIAAGQVAQGRYVIVLEHGVIKADYCRLNAGRGNADRVLHLLSTISDGEYLALIKGVESMRGLSRADFIGHVQRSFPGAK